MANSGENSSIHSSSLEPVEICYIRPPTENYSLTFRLPRLQGKYALQPENDG